MANRFSLSSETLGVNTTGDKTSSTCFPNAVQVEKLISCHKITFSSQQLSLSEFFYSLYRSTYIGGQNQNNPCCMLLFFPPYQQLNKSPFITAGMRLTSISLYLYHSQSPKLLLIFIIQLCKVRAYNSHIMQKGQNIAVNEMNCGSSVWYICNSSTECGRNSRFFRSSKLCTSQEQKLKQIIFCGQQDISRSWHLLNYPNNHAFPQNVTYRCIEVVLHVNQI